jgi:hypothetical protein
LLRKLKEKRFNAEAQRRKERRREKIEEIKRAEEISPALV